MASARGNGRTVVGQAARAFSARVRAAGYTRDDKILIWGENRPEWIVAFWGAV